MTFREKDKKYKKEQKQNYDRRHRVRETSPLPDDAAVWVTHGQENIPGRVSSHAATPRSYIVTTASGDVRRTRSHLRSRADSQELPVQEPAEATNADPEPEVAPPAYCLTHHVLNM